jgi:hypothetical protein
MQKLPVIPLVKIAFELTLQTPHAGLDPGTQWLTAIRSILNAFNQYHISKRGLPHAILSMGGYGREYISFTPVTRFTSLKRRLSAKKGYF